MGDEASTNSENGRIEDSVSDGDGDDQKALKNFKKID